MQHENARRSNAERSETMRATLIEAARRLFTGKGYAATGTPELVEAAGVTRGALYHHFADKQALFAAVAEAESAAVAAEIEAAAPSSLKPVDALVEGSIAYLHTMRAPGRTRLLLLDGPAVLGRSAMDEIDARHGNRTLREGLAAAMRAGAIRRLPLGPLTSMLGAMLDRAALDCENGVNEQEARQVVEALFAGLAA
ncbi:TetR/AcrR family transcriptional regulator [Mesorhizobium sp. J428]|uniref:TetR/AcrR family transcriptional regulator n=1 Tax=Mesorhizobium sp. J428 TaxID=2898440 RepID=UPI00215071A1|nr:TetR/AcrR family transcriptional regulator [Mesorhizobium sp. J428]MCR5855474.1 TetR/AcrR family transcriptional regulator [Mesorhizobium sp. J428]